MSRFQLDLGRPSLRYCKEQIGQTLHSQIPRSALLSSLLCIINSAAHQRASLIAGPCVCVCLCVCLRPCLVMCLCLCLCLCGRMCVRLFEHVFVNGFWGSIMSYHRLIVLC